RAGNSSGFKLGLGNYSDEKLEGFVNTEFGDSVYGRAAIFYETRDGYVDNLGGGNLQGIQTAAVRGSLHFNVGDSSGLDLILNHELDTPPGTAFRSMVIPSRNSTPGDVATFNTWLG